MWKFMDGLRSLQFKELAQANEVLSGPFPTTTMYQRWAPAALPGRSLGKELLRSSDRPSERPRSVGRIRGQAQQWWSS
jgi:hypothetical protein